MSVTDAQPASAHVTATVAVNSPGPRALVAPGYVDVVIEGRAPGQNEVVGRATFSVLIDGRLVDRNGTVGAGAAFTSLSVAAGERLTLRPFVSTSGAHQIVVKYAAHSDNPAPDLIRDFIVEGDDESDRHFGGVDLAGFAAALLVLVAAIVTLRRKRLVPR